MTEQAVKPVLSVGTTLAGIRAATRTVTGGKRRVTQRQRKDE
jgi:hypothetical protein